MGNRARIKKMLCQSGLEVWEKKRFFRGKRGKANREKIAKANLIAVVNPAFLKKKKECET